MKRIWTLISQLILAVIWLQVQTANADILSFQDGMTPTVSYAGTRDTSLSQNQPTTVFGLSTTLLVDGDDPSGTGNDLSSLLRWDISAIPPGSSIESAEITLQVTNSSTGNYGVYQLLAPWIETEATWNQSAAATSWQLAGARGALDRSTTVLGTVSASSTGSYTFSLNSSGLAVVQAWIDDPNSNHGLIIADSSVTNGLDILSRETATITQRPKLTIAYSQAPQDTDGDGVPDAEDAFPDDPTEWSDADADGTGDNADLDDDNDGMPDTWELQYGFDPLDPTDADGDADGDGVSNLQEYLQGTDPQGSNAPKNIILFIADGMGFEQVKAARMFENGNTTPLSFESFPVNGQVTTANYSGGITDSAAAGTAMATGRKVDNGVVSVAIPGDGSELPTAMEIQKNKGKRAGLVTTFTNITDATPATFGAHEADRSAESEIANDYFTQTLPNVLFGLAGPGITLAAATTAGYEVVTNESELQALDPSIFSLVSGQFTSSTIPRLSVLTARALDILQNAEGFFLLVEHEGTDDFAHDNDLGGVIDSLLELRDAVDVATAWANGRTDTLIIVTSDHETGGLLVNETDPVAGEIPEHTFTSTAHTLWDVPVYARGPQAYRVAGTIDNTDFFNTLAGIDEVIEASTMSFQDGIEPTLSYSGTRDTSLSQNQPTTVFGLSTALVVDGDDPSGTGNDVSSLLRWDISAIPPGSSIESAVITLQVTNSSTGNYGVYQLLAPWTETEATWNQSAAATSWQLAGALGTLDRGTISLGTVSANSTGSYTFSLNSSGLAVVRAWVDDPNSNHGLIIADSSVTNGLDILSRETATAAQRPKLTIAYSQAQQDSDEDGMPDTWENFYGLDALDPGDANIDGDLDGTSNLNEYRQGTHPRYVSVSPTGETEPMLPGAEYPSPADDPALWINTAEPSASRIFGTDKDRGLAVYDLAGSEVQFLADGKMNNVDVRYNFILGSELVALVAAGNRTNNSIAVYKVDNMAGSLSNVAAGGGISAGIEVYGSCMFTCPVSRKTYVFVNSKLGEVEQWELFDNGNALVSGIMVRSFDVGTQTEGCVADDEYGVLYIGEEDVGIWRYGADPSAGVTRTLVDTTGASGHLTTDVEGLSIYYASNGTGYLAASSQSSSEYVLYQREGDNRYVGTFNIVAGNGIAGTSGSDGIDVTNVDLGPAFPEGVFVAHDDIEINFKLVPWQSIANAFSPPLTIDTSWSPTDAPLDTDGDGIVNNIDLDDDNDGLSDIVEASLGTSPTNCDSDADGLSDFDEVNVDLDPGSYQAGVDTDPNNPDTDLDGLPDGVDPDPLIAPDGDLAPYGAPDGVVNAADLLIAQRIVLGLIAPPTPQDLAHGDVYPPGSPDSVINLSDYLIIQQMVLSQ